MAWPSNQMSEKLLNVARCKFRGGDQRVVVVYDDQTLAIRGIRIRGRAAGTVSVKVRLPDARVIGRVERLAHKADEFDLIDLSGERLQVVAATEGRVPFVLPEGVDLAVSWF